MSNYIRIPNSNMTRNENELRAVVDTLLRAQAALVSISDKMNQIAGSPADDTKVEIEYNLEAGQGVDVRSLVGSAANEFQNSSPFLQQLLQRMG